MSGVYTLGRISIDIYRCVNNDIATEEVIITGERLEHIRERHPDDFNSHLEYLTECIECPDYILEDMDSKIAVVLKHIHIANAHFRVILKLQTSHDVDGYKNSVMTFMSISEKKWNKYLRNKNVLYKRE